MNFILESKKFSGKNLDLALAHGFYRSQHTMFSINCTYTGSDYAPDYVYWLRTNLKKIELRKHSKQILKSCSHFDVQINDAFHNQEIENLFERYREHIDFNTSKTCKLFLQDDSPNPFNSKLIEVRDGGKLIAAGFFDYGATAIAGILNFYHPAYRRYSLGKFLMLQKIEYAIQQNMQWYYTGYLSTGSSKFDYKIFPNGTAIEVYLPNEKIWVPYSLWNKEKLKNYCPTDTHFFQIL